MIDRALRARVVLTEAAALGLEVADLVAAAEPVADQVPTVAAFVEGVAPTFTLRTATTYRPYWRLAVDRFGDRPVDDIDLADLSAVVADAIARAKRNRPTTSGRASQETCIAAMRALFARAAALGLRAGNPAAALTKPRRSRSRRRALDDRELDELISAVRTTSRDPDLDLLVIRFHLESGARRQGALNLRRRDLDTTRATVWLREKDDTEREQPVSPSLVALLARHLADRAPGSDEDDAVLRTCHGPMSARRYDTIFRRARTTLGWSDRTPVSAHVLRHTAITAVGRLAGYPVAQAFAGHTPPSVTGRYLHASLADIAAAIATLTGEPHPLAKGQARCASNGRFHCHR